MFLHVLDDPGVDCALEAVVAVSVLLLGGALNAHSGTGIIVVVAGAFASSICLSKRALHSLVLSR